jgi:hypothetical protein
MGRWLWSEFSAIFDNFRQKMAFFTETNVMIKILHNLDLFWDKNANFFADLLGENIFKIKTSVPDKGDQSRFWKHWQK